MFGKKSHLNSLVSRKQMLIAESDLNRSLLSADWQTMAHVVGDIASRAKTISTWASTAALMMAGFTAWRNRTPLPGPGSSSWIHKIFRAARVATTIWLAFRPHHQKIETH
jgi:hypothetical protein